MQLRNIQSSHPSPRHSRTASPWLLHNVQLWSTAVCWETSAPLLLQNPLITWFCLRIAAFNIPAMWTKEKKTKQGEHTNSVQMTQGNTVTGNAFATNSAPSPQWLVLHANQDGWACCSVISPIMAAARNPHGISLLPIFLTLSVSKQSLRCTQTVSGMSAVTELGSTVSFWSLAGR